jgi:hypothetical protein
MSRKVLLRVTFAITIALIVLISFTELARLIVKESAERRVQHSAHYNLRHLEKVLMVYYNATGGYPDSLDNLYPQYMYERLESWYMGGASSVVYHYNKPNDVPNGDFVIVTYTASWDNDSILFYLYMDGTIRHVED